MRALSATLFAVMLPALWADTVSADVAPEAPRPRTEGAAAEPASTLGAVTVEARDGRERVILQFDRASAFRVVERGGEHVLEVRGAVLDPSVSNHTRGNPAGLVRRVRVEQRGEDVVVRVVRGPGARGTAVRAGNRILWVFSGDPQVAERPRARTVARERDYRDAADLQVGTDTEASELEGVEVSTAETDEAAAFLTDVPLQVAGARRRGYSGRRIDLDVLDADIHNILRLLAEVGGVNIIAADNVQGQITLRLLNVPWDQALDVVLQAKGLGMVRRGNLIRVAPLSQLQQERDAAIARQRQNIELAPIETRLVPVSYATATDVAPRVSDLLSERGSVSVDERTNILIVRDIDENLDAVEELIRSLDTQTPQVLIEARIVEATSQYSRDVGIQWGGDVSMSSATGNPTGLVFPSNVGLAGGATSAQGTPTAGLSPFSNVFPTPNYVVNLPAAVGTGAGGALGMTLGSVGGNFNLNVRLSAAEARGTVRIISSPRILTLDNHEATIAQGTLIPYSVVSAQGVNTAFQEAKLELNVRPHVTADGSVSMHVRVTRDEPDFSRTSVRGDPTILKREAETDLLIPDGHTAVIGGIYTRTTSRNVRQVPFFGDIPVLGVLFQNRQVRDDRNELLIFITPRIVNRAESLPQ
ncbi:MAG: type IV pilus secretin PilQ [Polyangiales bacterium]